MYLVKVNDSIVAYGLSFELEAYTVAQQYFIFFSEEGGIVSCQSAGEGENGERSMMPGERPSSMMVSRSMSA